MKRAVMSHETIFQSIYQPLTKVHEIRTRSGMVSASKWAIKTPLQPEKYDAVTLGLLQLPRSKRCAARRLPIDDSTGQRPTLGASPVHRSSSVNTLQEDKKVASLKTISRQDASGAASVP